ncbi:hypothetical protein RGU75_20505 [Glaciimonas sp. CA11.2]|uniref:hypothetical protein n=1 Tax=Glaciimonas sp. CA11.2 TaxID=3048601 RepID=UPI002AB5C17D|nr:hypothetical protein [Glaciimonas sp. CA11.2]MDY7548602.1 hypothetical protein [Glaciimonas sp. CA11.2]
MRTYDKLIAVIRVGQRSGSLRSSFGRDIEDSANAPSGKFNASHCYEHPQIYWENTT